MLNACTWGFWFQGLKYAQPKFVLELNYIVCFLDLFTLSSRYSMKYQEETYVTADTLLTFAFFVWLLLWSWKRILISMRQPDSIKFLVLGTSISLTVKNRSALRQKGSSRESVDISRSAAEHQTAHDGPITLMDAHYSDFSGQLNLHSSLQQSIFYSHLV